MKLIFYIDAWMIEVNICFPKIDDSFLNISIHLTNGHMEYRFFMNISFRDCRLLDSSYCHDVIVDILWNDRLNSMLIL